MITEDTTKYHPLSNDSITPNYSDKANDMSTSKQKGFWIPGVSGNPGGRPRNEVSITYWIKHILQEKDQVRAKNIAEKAVSLAENGNKELIAEVINRVDGKPDNNINVRGVVLHLGDEFVNQGIEANKARLAQLQQQAQLT